MILDCYAFLITESTDSWQRLGMMTLLGQNGHKQDFHQGINLIKYSADAADENAPQGAYVRAHISLVHKLRLISIAGIWHAFSS